MAVIAVNKASVGWRLHKRVFEQAKIVLYSGHIIGHGEYTAVHISSHDAVGVRLARIRPIRRAESAVLFGSYANVVSAAFCIR